MPRGRRAPSGGVDHPATPTRVATHAQARSLVPGAHVAAWVAGTYMLVAVSIEGHDIVVLAVGALLALATGLGVMRGVHRSQLSELVLLTNRIIGRTKQRAVVEGAEACCDALRDGRVHDGPHAPLPRHALDESQPPSFVGLAHTESMRYATPPFLRRADAYPLVVDAAYRGEVDGYHWQPGREVLVQLQGRHGTKTGLIPMRDDADVASLHRRGELELSDRVEDVNVVDRAKPTKH